MLDSDDIKHDNVTSNRNVYSSPQRFNSAYTVDAHLAVDHGLQPGILQDYIGFSFGYRGTHGDLDTRIVSRHSG